MRNGVAIINRDKLKFLGFFSASRSIQLVGMFRKSPFFLILPFLSILFLSPLLMGWRCF